MATGVPDREASRSWAKSLQIRWFLRNHAVAVEATKFRGFVAWSSVGGFTHEIPWVWRDHSSQALETDVREGPRNEPS